MTGKTSAEQAAQLLFMKKGLKKKKEKDVNPMSRKASLEIPTARNGEVRGHLPSAFTRSPHRRACAVWKDKQPPPHLASRRKTEREGQELPG